MANLIAELRQFLPYVPVLGKESLLLPVARFVVRIWVGKRDAQSGLVIAAAPVFGHENAALAQRSESLFVEVVRRQPLGGRGQDARQALCVFWRDVTEGDGEPIRLDI